MRWNKWLLVISFLFLCISCKESPKEHYTRLLQEWMHKEVRFPAHPVFTVQGKDTVDFSLESDYKILTYVDSMGCISCKLQLDRWKMYMTEDELTDVCFLFFFSPEKKRDIVNTLKANVFTHPVCIDEQNELNSLNQFPTEFGGQTFLLDKDNKILAMGNPIHNPKVKDLYLRIIQGENASTGTVKSMTTASIDQTSIDMGTFDWQQKQASTFTLTNTGDKLFVIDMVDTSGCITVDYKQEPIRPGDSIALQVTYKAKGPGYFRKTLRVYCNAESTPIRLTVSGMAEKQQI